MTFLTRTNIFFLVLVVTIYGQEDNGEISARDRWYEYSTAFTDLPRYFGKTVGCPAEHFYLDCNKCSCVPGKNIAACTKVGCPEIPQIVNWRPGKSCPAGRQFYWKCNTCRCDADGIHADCTKKACLIPNETISN